MPCLADDHPLILITSTSFDDLSPPQSISRIPDPILFLIKESNLSLASP